MEQSEKIRQILESGNAIAGEELEALTASLLTSPPVSIRLNPAKKAELDFEVTGKVSWCDEGLYLTSRPSFAADPLWHAGAYYVQEASSMFVGWIAQQIKLNNNSVVLDLCAAPGGKSTHLLSILPQTCLLLANESVRTRVSPLAENLHRWGKHNVMVSNQESSRLGELEETFDLVVADLPCSGEGMIRKDPVALAQWSPELVKQCVQRQRKIISDIWPAIKPGGFLIYSTCTFNRSENEENIQWICTENEAQTIQLNSLPDAGIQYSEEQGLSSYRFFPHKVKGEGFFAAVIQKPGIQSESKEENHPLQDDRKNPEFIRDFCRENGLNLRQKGDIWYAMPVAFEEKAEKIEEKINTVFTGLMAGKSAGKDFIPSHALALHGEATKYFKTFDLDPDQALLFIRREPLPGLNASGLPARWTLMTFKGIALGWAKQAGSRINNYYPMELRLRKV